MSLCLVIPQTNKLNNFINLIFEFVCGFVDQKKKSTHRPVYKVAAQLKITIVWNKTFILKAGNTAKVLTCVAETEPNKFLNNLEIS